MSTPLVDETSALGTLVGTSYVLVARQVTQVVLPIDMYVNLASPDRTLVVGNSSSPDQERKKRYISFLSLKRFDMRFLPQASLEV